MASDINPDEHLHVETLNLAIDEYIVYITARVGSILDNICLHSNFSNKIEAGGQGGEVYQVPFPPGQALGFITGGKNGDIHNLKFHHAQMPIAIKSEWTYW
jgi:hypothetical protein